MPVLADSRAACSQRTRSSTSAIDCSRPGTSERDRIDSMKKPVINRIATSMNSDEFVNDASKPNSLSGTNSLIWNCSIGLCP